LLERWDYALLLCPIRADKKVRDLSQAPPPRVAQMSKVYAVLLVVVALITMAAIGTLALVVVTDVGYLAYQVFKPGMTP